MVIVLSTGSTTQTVVHVYSWCLFHVGHGAKIDGEQTVSHPLPTDGLACFEIATFVLVRTVVVAAAASAWGTWVFALALVSALAVLLTSWRSLLPRKAWEDPSVVQINRLPTHSRLRNYPSFEEAAARGSHLPNVVDLRCALRAHLIVNGLPVRGGSGVDA